MEAWGDNGFGQTSVPALIQGKVITTVATGPFHSLMLISAQETINNAYAIPLANPILGLILSIFLLYFANTLINQKIKEKSK